MLQNTRQFFASSITNPYLGIGLLLLGAILLGIYLIIDKSFMPTYVRHDAYVTVPDVHNLTVEDARATLSRIDLDVEVKSNRYNPQLPRDVVVDQNPDALEQVKPGRRIYITINTGASPESTVPSLVGISLKEAINRLNASGLRAEDSDIQPDSIPHPYNNMVTKQFPEPGKIVDEGARVRLWYSTGLGSNYVTVPNLVGMNAREAQGILLNRKLRSVVLGGNSAPDIARMPIERQSHPEGTRLKEGSEIRLFVEKEAPEEEQP